MIIKLFIFTIMLLSFIIDSSYAAELDPILAKAGQYEFKKSNLDRFFSYASPTLKQQMESNPEQLELLVRHLVMQKLVADIARQEGFDKNEDYQEQIQYLTNDFLSKTYIVSTIVEKTSVTDDEVKEYYERNKEKFTTPEQIQVSHILIKVGFGASAEDRMKAREKARQIIEWLKKGEKFETLAKQYSDDQQTRETGGKLGYIPKGRMPKAFDEQAFSMKPGQIGDLVETDFGYHIIQVEDHKDAATQPFVEIKDTLKEQLKIEAAKSRVEGFNKRVEKDTGLEIYRDKVMENRKP